MADAAPGAGGLTPDVLIVGAGPVGLACAAELSFHGIKALVIEQNERTGQQPRAKTTNVRSMAHMRRWGIADAIKAAAPLPPDHPYSIDFRTRMFGTHVTTFPDALYMRRDTGDARYPEPSVWVPQYKVEAVLRTHAEALGVRIEFKKRVEHLVEDATGVLCKIRDLDTETVEEVRVPYVVGADGARSAIRTQLGFRLEGRHAYAQHFGLVIRAPALREMTTSSPAIMYWLLNREAPAISSLMDEGDLWTYGFTAQPDTEFSEEALKKRIAVSYGRDIDPDIVTVDRWAAHSLLANRYATARIFLAGDACHLHPPYGGYGMNLGISDAVDIGWKLAAVIKGWGGPDLLSSYEQERRPVHQQVIEEAVANHSLLPVNLADDRLEIDGAEGQRVRDEVGARIKESKKREFRTLGVMLGYCYSTSPIVISDGTEVPSLQYDEFAPVARPGCIAPHAWLSPGVSLYDRFGPEFSLLLTRSGHDAEAAGLQAAAAAVGMPLRIVDESGTATLRDLYGADLVLIRPDQHVAWRGDRVAENPATIIDAIRGSQP